ncbi:MAG: PQQ-binding-like beta-propeller repeat protein [Lentisphaerota bacterium]
MNFNYSNLFARALATVFCLLPAALGAQSNPAPNDGEAQRVAAVRKRADDAYRARDAETGNQCLRELIEAYPGRWDIARPALEAILRAALRDGPDKWQEYAAARLIAAYRAGRILPTDPVLREAWGALITLRGYQDRFLEAQAEIAALEQATGRDVWVQFLEAELCYQADSYETAARFAEILSKISADDSDPYVRAVWQSIFPSEGRKPNPKYLESAMAYQPGRRQPSDAPRNLSFKDFAPSWEAVREPPPETVSSQLHALIGETLEPGRFIADDRTATTAWLWPLIDRHLLSQKPEALLPLRRVQQAELASAAASGPAKARDAGGLIERFRRYPWTDAGQRQLLEYGRRELSDGHAGLAVRSFRDVLSHATNPALRSEALVALWLALAQQDDRDTFEAAFRDVNPEERYSWMGGTETARAIRDRLEKGLPAAATPERPAPRLGDLERRLVRIPALAPWPSSWRQADGSRWNYDTAMLKTVPFIRVGMQLQNDGLLVSAPNMMAWYRADHPGTPVWQRTARFTESTFRRLPGIYRPPVIDGRIYTRWGDSYGCPFDVAALDTRTGRQLWSTAQDNAWRNQPGTSRGLRHWPLNDPVYADGRLYLLAARIVEYEMDGVYLVCLDPDTGAQLWACQVSRDKMKGAEGWRPECNTDLALYGNAVTCHQGAVYCATGAGIVSRVDARDGRLEWAYRYPRTKYTQKEKSSAYPWEGDYAITWGAPPQVAGNRVICMPRDANGVFALDTETGSLVWQNALVHPSGAVGIYAGALLLYDYRNVVALDLATGATRWVRSFEEGDIRGVQRIGSSLYVGTGSGLCRLDARSGAFAERMAWDEKERKILDYAILDKALYVVSDEAVPTDGFEAVASVKPSGSGAAGKLAFPLRRAWRLARANSQLYVPPPDAGLDGAVFLLSDGVVERLRLTPNAPSVIWQRLVQPDLGGVRFASGRVVLDYPTGPVLLDGETGAMRPLDLSADGKTPVIHPIIAESNAVLSRVAFTPTSCFCLLARGKEKKEHVLYRYGLDGKPAQPVPGCPEITFGSIHAMSVFAQSGPYVALQFRGPVPWHRDIQTGVIILREDDPSWSFTTGCLGKEGETSARPGILRGERYYDAVSSTGTVRVFDLKSRRMLASGSIPSWPAPDPRIPARIIDFRLAGDSLAVLSAVWDVRADVFDAETCVHKGGQVLDKIECTRWAPDKHSGGDVAGRGEWENEIVPGPGLLAVTDKAGLHVLVPAERVDETAAGALPFPKLYRRREPIVADGSIQEWALGEHVELSLRDVDGKPASLLLAQDGRNLFAAIAYEDERVDPLSGNGLYNDGDWITLEQGDGPFVRNARIGLDRGGGTILKPEPGGRGRTLEATAGIGYDLKTLRHIYEVVLPLTGTRTWAQGLLSLSVSDVRGLAGPTRIIQCEGLQMGYHALTRDEEDAIFALVRELPDLPESRALYAKLQKFYDAWAVKMPPYPPSKGPVDEARAAESLRKYLSVIGPDQFPYSFYRLLQRYGGADALPPEVRAWSQRKAEIEAKRQGPYQLNDSLCVTNWLVMGYFPYPPYTGGLGTDFLQGVGGEPRHVPNNGVEIPTGAGGTARWLPYSPSGNPVNVSEVTRPYSPSSGDVDVFDVKHLNLSLEAAEQHFVVYAACWLEADRDTECELRVSTVDDSWKIYVDHEPLGDYSPMRGAPDANGPRVRLEKGRHLVLVKLAGTKLPPGAGHVGVFVFSLRVTAPKGARPPGITVWN